MSYGQNNEGGGGDIWTKTKRALKSKRELTWKSWILNKYGEGKRKLMELEAEVIKHDKLRGRGGWVGNGGLSGERRGRGDKNKGRRGKKFHFRSFRARDNSYSLPSIYHIADWLFHKVLSIQLSVRPVCTAMKNTQRNSVLDQLSSREPKKGLEQETRPIQQAFTKGLLCERHQNTWSSPSRSMSP